MQHRSRWRNWNQFRSFRRRYWCYRWRSLKSNW